jgi:hypothetical protein
MKELLTRWWEGTYVPPPPNHPNSPFFLISPGTYKLHWTAKAAHVAKTFLDEALAVVLQRDACDGRVGDRGYETLR